MKISALAVISICLLSLVTSAQGRFNAPINTLVELQRGIRGGYLQQLSPEKQQRFMGLLQEASDLLFKSERAPTYACVNQGNGWFSILNLETRRKLGQDIVGFEACRKLVPNPRAEYACVNQGNGWFAIINMLNGQKLGTDIVGFNECTAMVPADGTKFACVPQGNGWFAIINLHNNTKLGQNIVGFNECRRTLP